MKRTLQFRLLTHNMEKWITQRPPPPESVALTIDHSINETMTPSDMHLAVSHEEVALESLLYLDCRDLMAVSVCCRRVRHLLDAASPVWELLYGLKFGYDMYSGEKTGSDDTSWRWRFLKRTQRIGRVRQWRAMWEGSVVVCNTGQRVLHGCMLSGHSCTV